MFGELPAFLFLKDLATDPKTLRLLSQSLSGGTAPCCKGRWGVGVAAFATNCLIHLRGTKKYTGYCDKQGRRFEWKRGEMHREFLFCGASRKT